MLVFWSEDPFIHKPRLHKRFFACTGNAIFCLHRQCNFLKMSHNQHAVKISWLCSCCSNYNHRQKCWEALFISPFPPLPPLPSMQCWVSSRINCALNIQHFNEGWGSASLFANVMFGDILFASLGNMPFLNNGTTFPTTSVCGCSLICNSSV